MVGMLGGTKLDGSAITVTLVSGNDGRYSFPADRLRESVSDRVSSTLQHANLP